MLRTQQMLQLTYMAHGHHQRGGCAVVGEDRQHNPRRPVPLFLHQRRLRVERDAMKLARAYFKRVGEPGRYKFISRKGSYHGATFGTLALGGTGTFPKGDYEPLLGGVFHGPQPNPYRCEYGGSTPEEWRRTVRQSHRGYYPFQGPDSIAAVIAEPVSSPQGAVVPGPNYWPLLREVCDRYGCLLIADEVITGFGRTGKMFACEHWGITPT